jgi:hypothetical protein
VLSWNFTVRPAPFEAAPVTAARADVLGKAAIIALTGSAEPISVMNSRRRMSPSPSYHFRPPEFPALGGTTINCGQSFPGVHRFKFQAFKQFSDKLHVRNSDSKS